MDLRLRLGEPSEGLARTIADLRVEAGPAEDPVDFGKAAAGMAVRAPGRDPDDGFRRPKTFAPDAADGNVEAPDPESPDRLPRDGEGGTGIQERAEHHIPARATVDIDICDAHGGIGRRYRLTSTVRAIFTRRRA